MKDSFPNEEQTFSQLGGKEKGKEYYLLGEVLGERHHGVGLPREMA